MTDEPPVNDDELQRLLRPLNDDAAPPDNERMADAVAAATDAFHSGTPRPEVSSPTDNTRRRNPMTVLARPLAILTAAVAALLFALLQSPEQVSAAVTLGDALDDALMTSLELTVVKDGTESQVWVQQGSVRWETSPQQYQIAAGSRLWRMDDNKDASAAATVMESPWWQEEEQQVDLLAMLGAQANDDIRRLRPIGIELYHGRSCHVYEFTSGDLIMRCWTDEKTNALDTIAAWSDPQMVKTQPPLSELRLIKRDADIDESKFVVGGSLSVDGRTGRIVDRQGIVSLKPLTHTRWTPVSGPMLIMPGDWLRTDVRGANAATVELVSKYRVIVGPGSLVELAQPQTIVLHYGEVRIIGSNAADQPVELLGPDNQTVRIAADETVLYRLTKDGALRRVDEKPIWLAGYEGSSNEESIGSLIANVDGRNEPLTVGFHKVNVEIRDQIARTTIEESFVNHTNGRLEGTFHFPLPQDASISGFGMWINGELIEADVVEKQRAREIYETILRENRDPGLLEWAGGNIFKARVFPIEPHSEKRIKIVYTQVLPLRSQKFRYSYGLKSELLQKNPLRELSVNVLVNSALPLKSVTCPTHAARIQATEHFGRVGFSAQEYIPERDFEVVCELDTQQSDVVVVPHRRGDDGYFLAQVMPPSPEGSWQRDILPDGQPLNLLLVCDTSGSMDSQHRETQQQFVASVLSSLGPDDRFNLAVCDVGCQWKFDGSQAPNAESIAAATSWLQERRSLGWTDLDAMAKSVVTTLKKGSDPSGQGGRPHFQHVIYIGDGIATAGDADPQSFINRWKRATASQEGTAFHAVSVGSSFESTVLRAIASVGGGSVRQVTGEQTPARVARELLNEIAQPGLRDLNVEFRGIQVAAVYPESLPNLAAGTQQIIVGRYLPKGDGEDHTGQMIVTGMRDGKPVKYVSKIRLPGLNPVLLPGNNNFVQQRVRGEGGRRPDEGDSHESNSSPLPRPEQSISEVRPSRERANPDESTRGSSPSSALRAFRPGRMSNTSPRSTGQNNHASSGEKNNADATHENSFIPRLWARAHLDHLLEQGGGRFIQDQIIAMSEEFHIITPYTSLLVLETDADRERFGVKRRFLMRDGERFFADGRSSANFELIQQQMKAAGSWRLGMRLQILRALSGLGRRVPQVQPVGGGYSRRRQSQEGQIDSRFGGMGGGGSLDVSSSGDWYFHQSGGRQDFDYRDRGRSSERDGIDLNFIVDNLGLGLADDEKEFAKQAQEMPLLESLEDFDGDGPADALPGDRPVASSPYAEDEEILSVSEAAASVRSELRAYNQPASMSTPLFSMDPPFFGLNGRLVGNKKSKEMLVGNGFDFADHLNERYAQPTIDYTGWMNHLFPPLGAPPETPKPVEEPDWPEDVLAISKSLLQKLTIPETLGLRVRQTTEGRDPVWERQTYRSLVTQIHRPDQWLTYSWAPGQHSVVSWCDETIRGVWSTSFELGRTRKVTAEDLASMSPGNRPFAVTPLHQSYAAYNVELKPADGDVITLILTPRNNTDKVTISITIDTNRNIVLRVETKYENGQSSATEYADHVEVAGVLWPQMIRSFDAQGRMTGTTKQAVEELDGDAFAAALKQNLPGSEVQLLSEPLPSYRDAKIASESGSSDFDDHLVLMLDAFTTQDWDEALAQLEKLEAIADGKTGVVWIRQAVLMAARRNEESRQLLHQLADRTLAERQQNGPDRMPDPTQDRSLALAQYLLDQLAKLGDPNEQLKLLDQLGSIYADQPEFAGGLKLRTSRRANLLDQLGRVEESLALRKELAGTTPWDVYAQRQYSEALYNTGEHQAALDWLRAQLDHPEERQEYERYQLRDFYAELLRRENQSDELVTFLSEWLQEQPTQDAPYRMYLTALILADRTDDADKTAAEWITAGQVAEKHVPAERSKVSAAVSYALAEYHNLYSNRFDPKWLNPLLKAVRFWLPHDHHFDLVTRIVNHHRFQNSDEADLFRSEIAGQLMEAASDLSVTRLGSYISWTQSVNQWSTEQWIQLARIVRQRWLAENDHPVRRQLGDLVTSLYARHSIEEYLPFLRTRVQRERDAEESGFVAMAVQRLFSALIGRPWSIENETEALSLLLQLSDQKSPSARLAEQLQFLHRFVDAMLQLREVASRNALQAEEHPEELTRTELAERHGKIRKEAIEGLIASLVAGKSNLPLRGDDLQDEKSDSEIALPEATLHDWLDIERMYLDLKLDRNHGSVADECWKLLERLTADDEAVDEDTELTDEQFSAMSLAAQLKQRALTMITYLSVRKSAPDALRTRLKTFIAEKIAESDEGETGWHSQMITLLIALDAPEELERLLRDWIQGDAYPVAWQLMLGRLLAEQGTLDEAITLYESVQRKQQLSPSDYSMLADWYMATDRRDDYRRARIETFKVMEEWRLQQWIGQKRQPWYQTDVPLPTELDEDVLFAFQALFEKSSQPGNYVYELQSFYTACRDFRLLNMVPDAVIGRTPQQVYSFLTGLNNSLFNELRNEATADELLQRIEKLRAQLVLLPPRGEKVAAGRMRGGVLSSAANPVATPNSQPPTRPAGIHSPGQGSGNGSTSLDLRALDLLEAMIERKASEVLNQPAPHAAKAVSALQRSFRHEWADGEIRQMAKLLAQMGTITSQPIADERLRQLRLLHDLTEPGTGDRVHLSENLAHVLFYNHHRQDDAIAVQSAAIREYAQIHPDGWPAHLNDPLSNYVNLLEQVRRYASAETLLREHIAAPANPGQQEWMKQRRQQVMLNALSNNGTVSLGSGRDLFVNLLEHLRAEAGTGTDNYRYQVLSQIPQVFRTAKERDIAYQAALRTHAFEQFPELLDNRQNNYGSLVSSLGQTVHDLLNTQTAVEFLVTRMENYPQRLEVQWQTSWQQHGYQLAHWREEAAGRVTNLEPRILAIVLKELRRDLTTRQQSNRVMYDIDQSHFWRQKADDFAATAESVLAETSSVFSGEDVPAEERPATSGKRTVVYVAQYLYDDLHRYDRAIEIMFVAHRHDLLDVSQQITLCQWLHWQNRHAESIALLEPIVETYPDQISYRTMLITAYNRSSRPGQRDRFLADTDAHFRRPGLWTETNIAALATCCEENQLDLQAIGYFDELIPLHQRTQPNRGIGNGTLSDYYRRQGRAYSRLGRTKEAVDAISAAVVSWGPRHDQRSTTVNELREVLRSANDLDEFASSVELDAEKSGMDSPLIRKQIGVVYRERNQPEKAVPHLQKALGLQPHDLETHRTLLECCDALENQSAATDQLLAMIEIDRRNLELYSRLAERLKDNPALSERAATSLVESGATEAENHQALAELRQKQNRWQDAIQHWQHVDRLRSLEPTGLVNLAKAQVHVKDWPAARKSLTNLNRKEWPSRFDHLRTQIQQLQNQLPD